MVCFLKIKKSKAIERRFERKTLNVKTREVKNMAMFPVQLLYVKALIHFFNITNNFKVSLL